MRSDAPWRRDRWAVPSVILALMAVWAGTGQAVSPEPLAPAGGETTVDDRSTHAFGQPAANLARESRRDFFFGNRIFNTSWIEAPASVERFDGLGPRFNRVACSACHVRDGRGEPPGSPREPLRSMTIHVSLPGTAESGAPRPHPRYGTQIQTRAIGGVEPEAQVRVRFRERPGRFPDGERYSLRRPHIALRRGREGKLGDLLRSARVAPAIHGVGLLEAIPVERLRALEDPDDADGDGISGRLNRVWSPAHRAMRTGRFGWKAGQATLDDQNATALLEDMGITSTLRPVENLPPGERDWPPAGGRPEIDDDDLAKLVFYTRTLAVPAARPFPRAAEGAALFERVGCAGCHVPQHRTADEAAVDVVAAQTIRPYTDLLLHDMGPGLADGRPEFEASGREWRTPPLWGLGLIPIVNRHSFLLHDGRARDVNEAILWHGGEAEASRIAFERLSRDERATLVGFVESR